MTFGKIEVILFTLAFLVPGYIIYSTFSLFTPRKGETKELLTLRFLPFIHIALVGRYVEQHPWLALATFFFITFVSPLFLGLVVVCLDQSQVIRTISGKLGIHAMHSIPTAWDYKFSQVSQSGGRWVLVTMSDDRKIGGFFLHGLVCFFRSRRA